MKRLADEQRQTREEVTTLKAKAAVWGSISAFVVTSAFHLLIAYIK